LAGIRVVAADVDGTLTVRRGNLLLSLEAVEAIRELEARGVTVVLASGNSVPVTAGLARYIGARGPSVAENGCVVFYGGERIHVCRGRPPEELVRRLEELGFRQSWQNPYRHHDLAFYAEGGDLDAALRLVREYGMVAIHSGYALHVQPPGGGKDRGLLAARAWLPGRCWRWAMGRTTCPCSGSRASARAQPTRTIA